jgi:hypothetical protein
MFRRVAASVKIEIQRGRALFKRLPQQIAPANHKRK